jgi:hypothetical protein
MYVLISIDLWSFTYQYTVSSTVDELSALGLQAIGSIFGIHLDFWTWVIADDAADGYWVHNHSTEIKPRLYDLFLIISI